MSYSFGFTGFCAVVFCVFGIVQCLDDQSGYKHKATVHHEIEGKKYTCSQRKNRITIFRCYRIVLFCPVTVDSRYLELAYLE